ncbi:hypothetical protein AF72_06415 [Xylella taiwanensis]|uniref:Uncharacterized protein n=1 Tax=Xylella taiwanensis TaxID=1444770 RepID=Z9JIW8_9GAMM|nr:hypothetical protein AF72_06415 [Xylella taiwanensis]
MSHIMRNLINQLLQAMQFDVVTAYNLCYMCRKL